MPTAILLMILGALGYGWWNASRAAAELAGKLGREACRAAGVQWLDQTVHVDSFRLCRHENGWLGLERTFRFDYSLDGHDRHTGRLTLRGERMVMFSGPVMPVAREIEG